MLKYTHKTILKNNGEHFVIPTFNIYHLKNHWVINQPKIASSYMDSYQENNQASHGNFDPHSFKLLGIFPYDDLENQYSNENDKNPKKFNENKIAYEFSQDWNNLINNQPTKRKFIFLVRNPIQKFIAGLIQDFIMNTEVVKRHDGGEEFTPDELTQALVTNVSAVHTEYDKSSNGDVISKTAYWFFKNGLHQEKYEDIILTRLHLFFQHQTEDNPAGWMSESHTKDWIFWIYGLFNHLNDNPNASILDINIQSLHNTLHDLGYTSNRSFTNKFDTETSEKIDFRTHVKPKLLNIMVRYLIGNCPWGDITNRIQDTNLQAWVSLISRTYSWKFKGEDNINTVEDYFDDCYIESKGKTFKDLIDIESHKNWCSEKEIKNLENKIRTYNMANPEFSKKTEPKEWDASEHLDKFTN
jgi:hypothetical protein